MLCLRGGNCESGSIGQTTASSTHQATSKPPLKEYVADAGNDDNSPSPFSRDAADAVKLRIGLDGEWFSALFTHQIFGPKEEIIGYHKPTVEVSFMADSIQPTIEFRNEGVIIPSENRADGPVLTDVLGLIQEKAPADYLDSATWLKLCAISSDFQPPGRIVRDYNAFSIQAALNKRELIPRTLTLDGSEYDVRYEVYHCGEAQSVSEGLFRLILPRLQCLSMWLIERSSYMDAKHPNTTCLMLYETLTPAGPTAAARSRNNAKTNDGGGSSSSGSSGKRFRLVGFATLCREVLNTSREDLEEVTPLHLEVAGRPDMARLRVCQLAVVPPHQRRGHGGELLRAVYALARADAGILDVVVESPSEAFAAMRQQCELALLREAPAGRLDLRLREATPPWGQLQRASKICMTQMFALAAEIGSEAGGRGVRPAVVVGEGAGAGTPDMPLATDSAAAAEQPRTAACATDPGACDESRAGQSGACVGGRKCSTVAGVEVDLESVYGRARMLGFTRAELDDLLHAVAPDDLAGAASPADAAERLLRSVYMAVVADLAQAEGLQEEAVDELLGRLDLPVLVACDSPGALARLVLPLIRAAKGGAGRGKESL